jgi:exopolysaccharide production protein ExoQ
MIQPANARPQSVLGRPPSRWIAFVLLSVCLFFFSQQDVFYRADGQTDFDPSQDQHASRVIAGDHGRQLALLALGVYGACALFRSGGTGLAMQVPVGLIGLAFLVWELLSISWAGDPALAAKRVASHLVLVLAAVGATRRLTLRDVVSWAWLCSAMFWGIGLLCEVVWGAFRPFDGVYRFADTAHPNTQGVNCSLLMLAGFFLWRTERRRLYLVSAVLGAVFLYLTGSRASFCGALGVLAVYLVTSLKPFQRVVLALGLVCLAAAVIAVAPDQVVSAVSRPPTLGRDEATSLSTLEGRVELWEECWDYVKAQPLWGYGFNAFWTPQRIAAVSDSQQWGVAEAHCAYLDVALGIGVVGLVLFVLLGALAIGRLLALHARSGEEVYRFSALLLVYAALFSFMESDTIQFSASQFSFACLLLVAHAGAVPFRPQGHASRAAANALPPRRGTLPMPTAGPAWPVP